MKLIPPKLVRCVALLSILVGLPLTIGCGESAEEKMMRAAMRARPSSKDEKENEKQPVPPQTVDASIEDAVTTETTTVIAAEPQDAAAPPAAAVVAASGVKPISQRQPAEPLDEAQRRSMAAANLTKIA